VNTPARPELRVCGIRTEGPARYQIAYWRRRGPLLVQVGGRVVVPERDIEDLIIGIGDARRVTLFVGRDRA